MVKTRGTQESGGGLSGHKAIWDEKLTVTFCELCVKEIDAGNRPTTYLNAKGWENILAAFHAQTGSDYERPQLKNKWDTLRKEWRLWNDLIRNDTGLGWCPLKKTVNAPKEWWDKKIEENSDFKMFKKRGFDSRLNDMLWRMFGDNMVTGDHAWGPSLGGLPGGASTEDAVEAPPVEGLGDSNGNNSSARHSDQDNFALKVTNDSNVLHSNPDNHALRVTNDSDVLRSNQDNHALRVRNDKGKKSHLVRKSNGKRMSSQNDELCDTMSSPKNSASTIVFSHSQYGIQEAIDALRPLEHEVPRKSPLYFFATKIFQVPVKREMFLALDEDLRSWWLQCEYEEQNGNTRFTSFLATPSCGFQPLNQTPLAPPPPPPQGPSM